MARDEDSVLGGDEVGLDEVGAKLDAQRVVLERVIGQISGRAAAMADDQRCRCRVLTTVARFARQRDEASDGENCGVKVCSSRFARSSRGQNLKHAADAMALRTARPTTYFSRRRIRLSGRAYLRMYYAETRPRFTRRI